MLWCNSHCICCAKTVFWHAVNIFVILVFLSKWVSSTLHRLSDETFNQLFTSLHFIKHIVTPYNISRSPRCRSCVWFMNKLIIFKNLLNRFANRNKWFIHEFKWSDCSCSRVDNSLIQMIHLEQVSKVYFFMSSIVPWLSQRLPLIVSCPFTAIIGLVQVICQAYEIDIFNKFPFLHCLWIGEKLKRADSHHIYILFVLSENKRRVETSADVLVVILSKTQCRLHRLHM